MAKNREKQLEDALRGLLAEPYGCTLCDCGKPRNVAKGHQPDCPYEIANKLLECELCEGFSEKE